MIELTKEKIEELLKKNEALNSGKINKEDFLNDIKSHIVRKAVLGFDIYRYSQYPELEQTLIPHLFKKLYTITINHCIDLEPYTFVDKDQKFFEERFIDAGDGGFQIFDNPFQAVVFALFFQANIRRYGSRHEPTLDLFKTIGEITLRYSLTYDNIYSYGNNFYGPSIINNARIMAKDKLNRFLIDENALDWFNEEFNGIENLQVIDYEEDFGKIEFFQRLNMEGKRKFSLLFDTKQSEILKVDVLRIGEITSKLDKLSIHSLHIQVMMKSNSNKEFKKFTISLGNLNSTGIAE